MVRKSEEGENDYYERTRSSLRDRGSSSSRYLGAHFGYFWGIPPSTQQDRRRADGFTVRPPSVSMKSKIVPRGTFPQAQRSRVIAQT